MKGRCMQRPFYACWVIELKHPHGYKNRWDGYDARRLWYENGFFTF